MTEPKTVPFQSTGTGAVHETVSIQQISTGMDTFAWTIMKPAREVTVFTSMQEEAEIVELWTHGKPDKWRRVLDKTSAITFDPKFVFKPGTEIRVVVKSQPGSWVMASLKYQWLVD